MNTQHPILVIDDNLINLKLIRVILTKRGYEVRTAVNAMEALSLLESIHPSLILMDIQLPGMDGLTLTRKIKAHPQMSAIPIVALTAYAMKGDEEKTREAGCDGYISKPIDIENFINTITRIIHTSTYVPQTNVPPSFWGKEV